jgi:ketosteroid isomerase-like protein
MSKAFDPALIISLERHALERWGRGDPQGYLQIMAPEVTYFDPVQPSRLDGSQALAALFAPLTGKIRVDRFEMIRPVVQRHGDVALLTFNLVSYRNEPDGSERAIAHWNSTETYAWIGDAWRIIHSHWSFVKPELKQSITEES